MSGNKYEDSSDDLNEPLLNDGTDTESTLSEATSYPDISEVLKDSTEQPQLTIGMALRTDYESEDGPDSVYNYIKNVIKNVNDELARDTRNDIGFSRDILQKLINKLENLADDRENPDVDIKKVIRKELFYLRKTSSVAISEMFWSNVQSVLNEKLKFQPLNFTVYRYNPELFKKQPKTTGLFGSSKKVERYNSYNMVDQYQSGRVSEESLLVERRIKEIIDSPNDNPADDLEDDNTMRPTGL